MRRGYRARPRAAARRRERQRRRGTGCTRPHLSVPCVSVTPTSPPAGPLSASRSTLAFTAQGQSATVNVAESGYTGNIGFDTGACAAIASVTPASQQPAPATYTITAQGAGSCTLAFVDRFGQRAPVVIGVTLTQGTLK